MDAPVQQVPAIGYSITANIGDNKQIVFQHFVGADEDDAMVNRNLDRIFRLIDRQRAVAEIPELLRERRKLEDENAQYAQDLAEAEANHAAAQASLDVQIKELQRQKTEAFNAGYQAHAESGRRGEYKPKGENVSRMKNIEAAIEQCVQTKAKNDAEKEQHLQNMKATMDRRVARIALLNDMIAEAESKVT